VFFFEVNLFFLRDPQALDEVAVSQRVRNELYKFYPEAKIAYLKAGGNFCYISKSDEVNMHIKVCPLLLSPFLTHTHTYTC